MRFYLTVLSPLAVGACSVVPDLPRIPIVPDHGEVRTVEIQNFIGRIEISESRYFKVDSRTLAFAEMRGRDVVVAGTDDPGEVGCQVVEDKLLLDRPAPDAEIRINERAGQSDLSDLPLIRILAGGRNIRLVVRNSVLFGETGDLAEANIALRGCSRLDTGDIDEAVVNLSESAKIDMDDTHALTAELVGFGYLTTERIESGRLRVTDQAQLAADHLRNAGVRLDARGKLRVGRMEAVGLTLDQTAEARADAAYGRLEAVMQGTTVLDIEDGDLATLELDVAGRSEASYSGSTSEAKLVASGSGLLIVHEVRDHFDALATDRSEIRIDRDPDLLATSRIVLPSMGRVLRGVRRLLPIPGGVRGKSPETPEPLAPTAPAPSPSR